MKKVKYTLLTLLLSLLPITVYAKSNIKMQTNNFIYILILILIIFGVILLILFWIFPGLFTSMIKAKLGEPEVKRNYGYLNNKEINLDEVLTFKDLPCKGDIYRASVIPYLNNFEYHEDRILGAILLKMIREKKIELEDGLIKIIEGGDFTNSSERKMFEIMRKASIDGILSTKDLTRYCETNYKEYMAFLKGLKDNEIYNLQKQGHIYKRTSKEECLQENILDEEIYEDTLHYYGLRKYLKEFTLIDEKELQSIILWDEYIMFAYLFGMAKEVAKELKDLDIDLPPDFSQIFDYSKTGNGVDIVAKMDDLSMFVSTFVAVAGIVALGAGK